MITTSIGVIVSQSALKIFGGGFPVAIRTFWLNKFFKCQDMARSCINAARFESFFGQFYLKLVEP